MGLSGPTTISPLSVLMGQPCLHGSCFWRFSAFRGIFARSKVVVNTRKVRLLGSGAALAETDYELRDYDRLPPGIAPTEADGTLRTRLKYVWTLTIEGWRIIAAQNTAILPRPPAR